MTAPKGRGRWRTADRAAGSRCILAFVEDEINRDDKLPRDTRRMLAAYVFALRRSTPNAPPHVRGTQAVAFKLVRSVLMDDPDTPTLNNALSVLVRAAPILGSAVQTPVWRRPRGKRAVEPVSSFRMPPRDPEYREPGQRAVDDEARPGTIPADEAEPVGGDADDQDLDDGAVDDADDNGEGDA